MVNIYELINEIMQERDYLISQLVQTFDAEEQNRLIGRVYQQTKYLEKLNEKVREENES